MKFVVKGLRDAGAVVRLTVEAPDVEGARRTASAQGLAVVAVSPLNPLLAWAPRRRTRFSLELFCQELVSLLDSGLSLVECVETLAEKEEHRSTADALADLRDQLHRGLTLSAALEQLPALFPPLFVATVRAAERTGVIREAVTRYLEYHAQLDRVRRKLVAASVYPAVLLLAGLLVSAFLMFYVVPKFSRIYEELGSDLPLLTRALVQWGRLLEAHAASTLATLALLGAAAAFGLTRPRFRLWLAPRIWRLPAVGARLRVYELARFYRNLGMLLGSGVALPAALDMARGLLSPFLRDGLALAVREIREGQPLSRSFQRHGLTTPVALRLLRVGERSGHLPHAFERIAVFLEDELARWVDWFTRLIEPVLMVLIGALVGLIVVLLYLPIFELAENIG